MDDDDQDYKPNGQSTRKRKRNNKIPEWFANIVKETLHSDSSEDENDSDEESDGSGSDSDSDAIDDSGYFEQDTSKLKATIGKHVLSRLSKNQRDALKTNIEKGIDDAFTQLNDIMDDSLGYFLGVQPTSNLWKLGMGPDEIKKYSKQIKELRRDVAEQDTVTMQRILDAHITSSQKRHLVRQFDTLQGSEPYSEEYYEMEATISEKLQEAEKSPVSPEDLKKMDQQECDLKQLIGSDVPLKVRILTAEMDDAHKAAIYEKYLLLQKTPDDSVTYASLEEWIEEALKTPYSKMTEDITQSCTPGECLVNLSVGFKSRLAEMDSVLEPLLVFLNKRLHNPSAKSTVIGLLGAPGCGKTATGEVIADVWKLPFKQISLGGVIDSSILDGQHPGWVGSNPGRFAKALQEMGVVNGVLFLDEIDKLGDTTEGIQVQNSLLHSTDPSQNAAFNDHYLGSKLTLDLSKTLIICALNSIENLSSTLLSRIHIIKIPEYTNTQKMNILTKHLFPDALKDAGLSEEDVQLSPEAHAPILSAVERYVGKEGGVRGLKACINIIVDKLALLLKTSKEEQGKLQLSFNVNVSQRPTVITPEIVNELYKLNDESGQSWRYMYT